jgi:hypothetical protein
MFTMCVMRRLMIHASLLTLCDLFYVTVTARLRYVADIAEIFINKHEQIMQES